MFFTIKLHLHLNCVLMLNWIVWNRTIFIKMDLALNDLQWLMCHKTQPIDQQPFCHQRPFLAHFSQISLGLLHPHHRVALLARTFQTLSLSLSLSLSHLSLPSIASGRFSRQHLVSVQGSCGSANTLHVRVKGSIGECRLLVRRYFSNSVSHVLLLLFGWFYRWRIGIRVAVVLWDVSPRFCLISLVAFLCNSPQASSLYTLSASL